LEETGVTIATTYAAVCFIVPIADIHKSNNSRNSSRIYPSTCVVDTVGAIDMVGLGD
jgi:hypothetical protein